MGAELDAGVPRAGEVHDLERLLVDLDPGGRAVPGEGERQLARAGPGGERLDVAAGDERARAGEAGGAIEDEDLVVLGVDVADADQVAIAAPQQAVHDRDAPVGGGREGSGVAEPAVAVGPAVAVEADDVVGGEDARAGAARRRRASTWWRLSRGLPGGRAADGARRSARGHGRARARAPSSSDKLAVITGKTDATVAITAPELQPADDTQLELDCDQNSRDDKEVIRSVERLHHPLMEAP